MTISPSLDLQDLVEICCTMQLIPLVFWELLFLLSSAASILSVRIAMDPSLVCSVPKAHCGRQLRSEGEFPTTALGLTRLPRQPVGSGEGTTRRGVGGRGVAEGAGVW